MTKARTKEEFDNWFKSSNGDPWHYDQNMVKDRIARSIAFIQLNTVQSFKGTIIEFGAFNGDFTIPLANYFYNAKIIANDISSLAVQKIRQKSKELTNVTIFECDMLDYFSRHHSNGENNESIILLLECLYYLNNEEQYDFLKKINNSIKTPVIYFSAPFSDQQSYYEENNLLGIFRDMGFEPKKFEIISLKFYPRFTRFFFFMSKYSKALRNKMAHQIIYKFEKVI